MFTWERTRDDDTLLLCLIIIQHKLWLGAFVISLCSLNSPQAHQTAANLFSRFLSLLFSFCSYTLPLSCPEATEAWECVVITTSRVISPSEGVNLQLTSFFVLCGTFKDVNRGAPGFIFYSWHSCSHIPWHLSMSIYDQYLLQTSANIQSVWMIHNLILYICYNKATFQMVSCERERHGSSVFAYWQMLSDHWILCRQW